MAVSPGGRPMDTSPFSASTTDNWVARTGGLNSYIRGVAHAVLRTGRAKDEATAISLAVAAIKRWAAGGDHVHPQVQAAAAAALADWNAKRAKAHSHANDGDAVTDTVDLSWNAALHPRGAAGTSQGGKFVSASSGSSTKTKTATVHSGKTGLYYTKKQWSTLHQEHMEHLQHLVATGKATKAQKTELSKLKRQKLSAALKAKDKATATAKAKAAAAQKTAALTKTTTAKLAGDAAAVELAMMTKTPRIRGASDVSCKRTAPGTVTVTHKPTGMKVGTLKQSARGWQGTHATGKAAPASGSMAGALSGLIGVHNRIAASTPSAAPMSTVHAMAAHEAALELSGSLPSTSAATSSDGPRVTTMGGGKVVAGPAGLSATGQAIYKKLIARGLKPGQALAMAKRAAAMHAKAASPKASAASRAA